jgi:PIN domain
VLDDFEALSTKQFHTNAAVVREAEDYGTYLQRRFAEASATIMPTPLIEHDALIRRAASRRRPFNDSGGGYRDALLWEMVCHVGSSGPVMFLSNDHKAFADPNGGLHDHLRQDLDSRDLSGLVTLHESLAEVMKDLGLGSSDLLPDIQDAFKEPTLRNELQEELNGYFGSGDPLPYRRLNGREDLPSVFEDPWLERVYDIHDVVVSSADPIGDDSYSITGTAQGAGQVYSLVAHETAQRLSQMERNKVIDAVDNGDDVALVTITPVWVEFSAVFTPPRHVWNVGVMDGGPLEGQLRSVSSGPTAGQEMS